MRIRILADLATQERVYSAGTSHEWDDADAARLIKAGHAEATPGDMVALACSSHKPSRGKR